MEEAREVSKSDDKSGFCPQRCPESLDKNEQVAISVQTTCAICHESCMVQKAGVDLSL
jgi:hypothetical protein